jgi:hypothetical protein
MIINQIDGKRRNVPFSPSNCIGYVASSIEFEGPDIQRMVRLFESDPQQFRAALYQLASRFPSNRAGG